MPKDIVIEPIWTEKDENSMVYNFPTVIPGGKEPPDGGDLIGSNWLITLPERTVFAAIQKSVKGQPKGFQAGEFHIVKKGKRAVLLLVNIQEPEVHFWADSVEFSKQMELLEILMDGNELKKLEVKDDLTE